MFFNYYCEIFSYILSLSNTKINRKYSKYEENPPRCAFLRCNGIRIGAVKDLLNPEPQGKIRKYLHNAAIVSEWSILQNRNC